MRKWNPLASINDRDVWLAVFNMLPTLAGSYAPPNLFTTQVGAGPATPGTTLRAWCALLPSDTAVGYVGTTTKLYYFDGSNFTDRSVGGGYTNTAVDWSFAQYGNNTYATNRVDDIQVRDSSAGSGGSAFAVLGGSPPKARILVTQADQLLLFDLNDGSEKPDAFAASAPGDPTDWSGAAATTATRIRHRPGKITAAIAFRDYVLVFKQGSIYRLYYTGNSVFKWKVELIAIGKGAWDKHSVCNCGEVVVFNGPGGSWLFDGSAFRAISSGEIAENSCIGSYYSPATQSAIFWVTGFSFSAYCIASDRWGQARAQSTAAAVASTYRPLTGEPAALRTLSGSITAKTPDVMWIADLSSNPCVMKSTLSWGDGAVGVVAYLVSSVFGSGGDTVSQFSRVIPQFDSYFSVNGFNPTTPGNEELLLSVFTANSQDAVRAQYAAGTPTIEDKTSSTAQRRFDINVASPYAMFYVEIPSSAGYVQINDIAVKMQIAGTI